MSGLIGLGVAVHPVGRGEPAWSCGLARLVAAGEGPVVPEVVGGACRICLGLDGPGFGEADVGVGPCVRAAYGTGKVWLRFRLVAAGLGRLERLRFEDGFREALGLGWVGEDFVPVDGERMGACGRSQRVSNYKRRMSVGTPLGEV